MREIKYIVLHCSATQPSASVESIIRYWRDVEKWKNYGYHFIIEANGNVRSLQSIDKPSNGVAGYNANSIHICYVGGIDKGGKPLDTRTPSQCIALKKLVQELHKQFPSAAIKGHRDFSPDLNENGKIDQYEWIKVCPSFDVATWLIEENIL